MNLREKKHIVSRNKSCFNCLGTGHVSSECKSNISCRSCRGKHHSLLCHASSGSKPVDKDKKQKFRKEETTVNQTESEQTNDEPSDEIVEGLEVTSNNLGRSFDLTSAESYYLSQQEHIQGQLTCVGTVQTKGQSLATAQCLFDICSTDSWVLTSFAEQIKAPECGQFDGLVLTINGAKRCIIVSCQSSKSKSRKMTGSGSALQR